MPIAIVRCPDFVYELSNPANQRFLNNEQVIGKSVRDLPFIPPQAIEILEHVYQTKKSFVGRAIPGEFVIEGKKQIVYTDTIFEPFFAEDGSVEMIMVTGTDVTEAVLAQKRAEAKEKRLQTVLDTIPQLVWTTDPSGKATFFNRKWWEYTGLDPNAYKSENSVLAIHPDDRPGVLQKWEESFRIGTPFEAQYRLRSNDGTYRWHLGRLLPVRDSQGEIMEWFGTTTDIHEQRRSRQELELLADSIPNIAWVTNADGKVEFFNAKWTEYTGLDRRETDLHKLEAVIHPDDLERAREVRKKGHAEQGAYEIEYRLRAKDGTYRWHLCRVKPVYDESGKLYRRYGTATDIDDVKQVQQQFQCLVESTANFVWATSNEGALLYANSSLTDFTGFTTDEFNKKGWQALIHPDDLAAVASKWAEAKERGVLYEGKFRLKRKDGTYHWMLRRSTPLKDTDGHILQWIGTTTDIQELVVAHEREVEAKRRLEDKGERLSLALEAAKLGAWEWDLRTHAVVWDQRMAEIYGFSEIPENVGLDLGWSMVHPEDRPAVQSATEEGLRTGKPYQTTYRQLGGAHDVRWVIARAKPILGPDGKPERVIGVIIDVTKEKETELQLRETLRTRDDFMSICSHEIRTPLSSLKLQTQIFKRLLGKGDLSVFTPERVTKFVEQADLHADRLTRLVDEMLDVSRIVSGRLPIEKVECDLVQITKSAIETVTPVLAVNGSAIHFESEKSNVGGFWDPFRVEQVINNLLSNAVKYGAGKPITVTVWEDGSDAFLRVKDQGLGIAKKDQDRIFDQFERAVSHHNISGLGLGLFISREIAEKHGGTIDLQSELNEGAAFTVRLPKGLGLGDGKR